MEDGYRILIDKYLSGNLTTSEVEELTAWLKEDKAHQQLLSDAKRNWMPEFGADESLEEATRELKYKLNLTESLNNSFSSETKSVKKLFINAMKIAAIFIAGILVTQVLQQIDFSGSSEALYCSVNADRGQKSRLTLPDGTEVWLNSETRVKFSNKDFLKNRYVELNGEAYFSVKHNKKSPFVVKTKSYDIEVLGTEFNVMAYEDVGRTETILVKGKVKIKKGEKEVNLNPGQKATFEANRLRVSKTDIDNASSWKSNELRYEGVSFQELVFSLERWFDVEIQVGDPRLYDVVYSGVFKNGETFEEVMEALKFTTNINYQTKGLKRYEITFEE
ncbi:DUF4974 domain-containing protein [Labilibacter sediminis]|nr:DUF4974 domain-containing protein [Labilibacter sediminis]